MGPNTPLAFLTAFCQGETLHKLGFGWESKPDLRGQGLQELGGRAESAGKMAQLLHSSCQVTLVQRNRLQVTPAADMPAEARKKKAQYPVERVDPSPVSWHPSSHATTPVF